MAVMRNLQIYSTEIYSLFAYLTIFLTPLKNNLFESSVCFLIETKPQNFMSHLLIKFAR